MEQKRIIKKYYLSKEALLIIRDRPELAMILTFSRILNSLHYCMFTELAEQEFYKPSAVRFMFNSFIYTCAVLYEGLNYLDFAGQYFEKSENARQKIKLFKCEIQDFRENALNKLRNNVAFHNNEKVIATTLNTLDFDKYVFATTVDDSPGETHFLLADEVAINTLLETNIDKIDEQVFINNAIADAGKYSKKYIELITFLITEAKEKLNIIFEEEVINPTDV